MSFYTHGARKSKEQPKLISNESKYYINVHVYEYINICKQLYMGPTSLIVKVLQTNAIIFTKCADLQIKNRVNYILIMAQVLHLSILQVLLYASRTLCLRKTLKL